MPAESNKAEPIGDLASVRRERENLEPLPKRLEQAEAELPSFFALSLDLLCVAGFDGYFKHLNPAWTTALGWTLQGLQDTPFLDLVHPDDREAT